jgi:hypothetical protein
MTCSILSLKDYKRSFRNWEKKIGKQELESRFVGAIFFLFNPLFYYYYIGTRDLFSKFHAYVFSVQNSRFSVCEINITFHILHKHV